MAKKYKIERNLVLNNIKEGGAEDSVLVIDANNEVGSVARSEFGGGGQDLQSVLNNGSIASGELQLGEDFSSPTSKRTYLEEGIISVEYGASNSSIGVSITGESIKINNQAAISQTIIDFTNLVTDGVIFNFPNKSSTNYTLATLDDIPTGLTQSITIGANTFTFTNGVLTDFETVEGFPEDGV